MLFEDGHAQTLRTTEEHPFWVPDQGWVAAQHVKPGGTLMASGDTEAQILSVRFTSERSTVYNFEVEGLHNYFVGSNGVLV